MLNLFRPMGFSIQLHTINSGWSIVFIEGSQIIISEKYCVSASEGDSGSVGRGYSRGD